MESNINERERFDPGWYRDISNERYHSGSGIGSTSLKTLLETSPRNFLYRQLEHKKSTEAMILGTLVHEMILEPKLIKEKYVECPDFGDLRTKAAKERREIFYQENEGKEPVKSDVWKSASMMAENILTHETASSLLDSSINESSVYWWYKKDYEDERDYKVMCKVRPDAISASHPGVIIDIKTTDDASFSGFAKSIHKFSYHLSAAMYLEGANQCKELLNKVGCLFFTSFVFIVIEKQPPYSVALYELSKEDLRLGRAMFRKAVSIYHDAKENDFPNYPSDVRVIELPSYAKYLKIV